MEIMAPLTSMPSTPENIEQPVVKPARRSAGDPSRLNRFAPLCVAFRSKYTRYSSLTRLVSRAPHRPRRSRGVHHRLLKIGIKDLTVLRGRLAPRALGLVMEWATMHQSELLAAWERAERHEAPGRISPLG